MRFRARGNELALEVRNANKPRPTAAAPSPGQPPRPPPGSGGIVETPIRPGNEEEKKNRRNIPPIPNTRRRPPDERRRRRDDPDPKPEDEDSEPGVAASGPTTTNTGYLRPSFVVGAQDILQLTEKERIEELKEWDLFDIPLPDCEDPDNPLYRHQLRQNAFRFSMKAPTLYTQGVKPLIAPGSELVAAMQPIMINQYEREQLGAGQMWAPFQMAPCTP